MKKETKIRFISGALTLMLANGIAFATPVSAETQKYKQGTFIEEKMEYEESQYLRYVATKDDNLSKISRKICNYFDVEVTNKYWPVLAYLNSIKKALVHPGDILLFPATFEDLDDLYNALDKSGWIKAYVKNNGIYKKHKKYMTIGELLAEIYGDKICVDPDFVQVYLEMQGLDGKYGIDSEILPNTDMLFYLTEWLPSIEQIEEYWNNRSKTKTK